MDLTIRYVDGWQELDGAWDQMIEMRVDLGVFWSAVARNDIKTATSLLEDSGWEFSKQPEEIKVISMPDDERGTWHRIWVKWTWPPKKRKR